MRFPWSQTELFRSRDAQQIKKLQKALTACGIASTLRQEDPKREGKSRWNLFPTATRPEQQLYVRQKDLSAAQKALLHALGKH